MKKRLLAATVFLNICLVSFAFAEQADVFRTVDGKYISYREMVEDLKKADVIFTGEVHNQEKHHELQLKVIKALAEAKAPVAVGLEMFNYESQKELDLWSSGSLGSEQFIPVYYKNWILKWELYDDIFFYIRENRLPAIALNLPPEITRKVSESGFASLTKEELMKLPPGTGCVVNEKYMLFIRRAYAMHGHGGKQFGFFCEAQLLWDQSMAHNISGFLKKNPGKKVVVLAGNGHAWKHGIPEQLSYISEKITYRVVLPYIEGHIDKNTVTSGDADYILLR